MSRKLTKLTVAVPFLCNDYCFTVIKKNNWSIIDYLFLKELCESDITLNELSEKSNLDSQIVLQILLPMCDVGWVLIENSASHFIFRVTELGKKVYLISKNEHEIPSHTTSYPSTREICVDDLGNYYNFFNSNLQLHSYIRYKEIVKESQNIIVELPIQNNSIYPDYEKLKKTAQNQDEIIDDIEDLNLIKIQNKKYLLVDAIYTNENGTKVINNSVLDILDSQLIQQIENIQPSSSKNQKNQTTILNNTKNHFDFFKEVHRNNVEFIYGGLDTKDKFFELINESNNFLIIHSTFIGKWCIEKDEYEFTEYFLAIKEALERGVFVYILWGKTNEEGSDNDRMVKESLINFNKYCKRKNLVNVVNYNEFVRTDSHAKFILTEHVTKGVCAMVSSCNFLHSNYNRMEASLAIYDNDFVKSFLNITANICCGKNAYNSTVRKEIRSYEKSIKKSMAKVLEDKDKLSITLVLKHQHYHYVDLARNHAKHKIYMTSDYINSIPERPIYEALEASSVQQKYLYYSEPSSYIMKAEIIETMNRLNDIAYPIRLRQSQRSNHSKVLAWDNNDVVISSLNWLSSNASKHNDDIFHEIGIHVHGWNVAKDFIKQLIPWVKNQAQ